MSKRILVVEDQPDNRQIIRDMLAATDYQITEAENGEEALAAIAKQRPDLILMDIQLPIRPSCFRSSSRPTTRSPAKRAAPAWGWPYRSASLRCTAAKSGSSHRSAEARRLLSHSL